jgi:hypothetical protein
MEYKIGSEDLEILKDAYKKNGDHKEDIPFMLEQIWK